MISNETATARLDWVDYAKGICIVMVVMMHSTLGLELAVGEEGFMHAVVAFSKPFRMPDFFLISGLFLARVIDRDWRTYLDRKVLHFVYFYVLWVTIQFAFKLPMFAGEFGWAHALQMYLVAFIEPFGTLWFIYLLPIFFVLTKATRRVSPVVIWLAAAALEAAPIATGWTLIDEFAGRFVYFYSGYLFANAVFALARGVQLRPLLALAALGVWALINGTMTATGISEWPVVSLALGFAGAGAVIAVGALLAQQGWMNWLRYCGEHSLMIYLAFFLPMAVTRVLLVKTGVISDVGVGALIVTAAGVVGALAIWWLTRGTWLNFLFERPKVFGIAPKQLAPRAAIQPAE